MPILNDISGKELTAEILIRPATAALTLGLAVSTVGFRALRAARANPVEPLRSE